MCNSYVTGLSRKLVVDPQQRSVLAFFHERGNCKSQSVAAPLAQRFWLRRYYKTLAIPSRARTTSWSPSWAKELLHSLTTRSFMSFPRRRNCFAAFRRMESKPVQPERMGIHSTPNERCSIRAGWLIIKRGPSEEEPRRYRRCQSSRPTSSPTMKPAMALVMTRCPANLAATSKFSHGLWVSTVRTTSPLRPRVTVRLMLPPISLNVSGPTCVRMFGKEHRSDERQHVTTRTVTPAQCRQSQFNQTTPDDSIRWQCDGR